jgi:hypothetical protein
VDAVLAEECGMHQLTDRLFVVNGWNAKKRESTVGYDSISPWR